MNYATLPPDTSSIYITPCWQTGSPAEKESRQWALQVLLALGATGESYADEIEELMSITFDNLRCDLDRHAKHTEDMMREVKYFLERIDGFTFKRRNTQMNEQEEQYKKAQLLNYLTEKRVYILKVLDNNRRIANELGNLKGQLVTATYNVQRTLADLTKDIKRINSSKRKEVKIKERIAKSS